MAAEDATRQHYRLATGKPVNVPPPATPQPKTPV